MSWYIVRGIFKIIFSFEKDSIISPIKAEIIQIVIKKIKIRLKFKFT